MPEYNPIGSSVRIYRPDEVFGNDTLRRFAAMLSQLDGRFERRSKPRAASRKPLSAKARASLRLQGRYMGYMR